MDWIRICNETEHTGKTWMIGKNGVKIDHLKIGVKVTFSEGSYVHALWILINYSKDNRFFSVTALSHHRFFFP